jgi:hypothetical protein
LNTTPLFHLNCNADERLDASRVACGEPPGQFGIIGQGACGYTNSDGSLPFPREMYAAAADANADYPGSCGRCYQVGMRASTDLDLLQDDLVIVH